MKPTILNLYKCKPNVYTNLPEGLKVGGWLDFSYCESLTSLPEGLKVGENLYLRGCTSLTSLPEGMKVGGYIVGIRDSGIKMENVPEHLRSKIKE